MWELGKEWVTNNNIAMADPGGQKLKLCGNNENEQTAFWPTTKQWGNLKQKQNVYCPP